MWATLEGLQSFRRTTKRSDSGTLVAALWKRLVINESSVESDAHVNWPELLTLCHAGQNLARDFREQRVGQNVVYVARAAFHFGAALGHFVDQRVVVGQGNTMRLEKPALDLGDFQAHDLL